MENLVTKLKDECNGEDGVEFYKKAQKYWSDVPPTIDGMLGGFGFVSYLDVQGSDAFLKKIFMLRDKPHHGIALDCGAGIGRITKNLLVKYFNKVDLVEQNKAFIEEAKKFLEYESKVRNYYCCGLQNFLPKENGYDVIWCQWVLGHLTDDHLVQFFKQCKSALKKNGIIIIKENITSEENVEKDEEDSSVTRPLELYKKLFKLADLKIVRECKQTNFPKGLYPVRMFALRPDSLSTLKVSITDKDKSETICDLTNELNKKISNLNLNGNETLDNT